YQTGLVPVNGAVVLGEGPTGDHGAGLQADFLRIDLQAHPLALLRQRARLAALGGVVPAEGDQVLTPVGAVLPGVAVPLEHDLPRRLGRVEVDVGEQLVALADHQPGVRLLDPVLGDARARPYQGLFPAENGVTRPDDEGPRE